MNLVVIESAGKLETIKKYLGKDFDVIATNGHFRDLPERTLGVNVFKNFEVDYVIMPNKSAMVKNLKEKAAKADMVYLATDPDREGEAISWHLANVLDLDEKQKNRIVFNEISKPAIEKALQNPRQIDRSLVDAQQARRVLDRLVGYKLSPILSKKIQPKLSAGRVQSVALKLIVDREKSILEFVPVEYWTLVARLFKDAEANAFKTVLFKINGKKAEISNKEEMDKVLSNIKSGAFVVSNVKKTVSKSRPSAPYTTSTMQQDASNKLGFSLKRTSSSAQTLYEGVQLGSEGKVALVTYIRTDSVRVAPEAVAAAKDHIIKNFGEKYYPKTPNFYKTKGDAQDAHEAIRPISLSRTPESVKPYLSPDHFKLYKLIYDRFLASQMAEATFNLQVVEIDNGPYSFKATGRTPLFEGFTAVYKQEKAVKKKKASEEDQDEDEKDENDLLPELNVGDKLSISELKETQKFTKPLPRYTEASIVNEMESQGIGRPATYSATITTLFSRNYVAKEGRNIVPTELAFKVTELLDKYFSDIINVKFTAQMEEDLDNISSQDSQWQEIVGMFFKDFVVKLKNADEDAAKFKIPPKPSDEVCDKCGKPMVIRTGRYGEFLACSGFPDCKNIKSLHVPKPVAKCPKCGGDVFLKTSKKGAKFYGCGNYPKCDFVSWNLPKPQDGEAGATNNNNENKNESK